MINKFKFDSINDIYEMEEGNLYILNLKGIGQELFEFGDKVDGEYYDDTCWIVEIVDRSVDTIEEIFYISFDGERVKYCDINSEFKEYLIEELDKVLKNN